MEPIVVQEMTTDDLLERIANAVTTSCILGVMGGITLGLSLVELRINPSIMNVAGVLSALVLLAFLYWVYWFNKKVVIPELRKRLRNDG